MSNITNSNKKPKPNINKIIKAARRNNKKLCLYCPICPYEKNGNVQRTQEFLEGEDGSQLCKFFCKRCGFSGWRCDGGNNKVIYNDIDSAKRHKRRFHNLKRKPREDASEENVANDDEPYKYDNYFDNLENDIDAINFIDNVQREDVSMRGYIQYAHDQLVNKFLVAKSQDKGCLNNDRVNTLDEKEVAMQINIASFCYELRPAQRDLLLTILRQVKESTINRRYRFNPLAYTKIPESENDIRTYYLFGNNSIVQNLPKPNCQCNGTMVNTAAEEPIRFALLCGSNIAMLRPGNIREDIKECMLNVIGHGSETQKEIIDLARRCPQEDNDRYIICIKEFRDEFNPYSTNNTNNSILLHTMSIVPVDSTIDTPEYTYPVGCGHKDKNNMIHEKFYVETLNELMKPNNKKKFYSVKLRKYISVVIFHVGIMMDQPGKRDYFSFAGGNGEYGAKFG